MLADGVPPPDEFVKLGLEAAYGICRMVVIYGVEGTDDPIAVAERGRELAERFGDLEIVSQIESLRGLMLTSGGAEQFARGVSVVENALTIAQRAGLALPAMSIARALSWVYLFDGRLDLARTTMDDLVVGLERAGHAASDVYLGALWMRDLMFLWSDAYDAALEGSPETLRVATAAGNRTVQIGAATIFAQIHLLRGEPLAARDWADKALETARPMSNFAGLRIGSAVGLLARLDLGESVAFGKYVETLDSTISTGGNMALGLPLMVEAYVAAGEIKRAARAAKFGYLKAGGRLREMLCSTAMADVMLAAGPEHADEARRWYDRALAFAHEIGHRSTIAAASLGIAELALAGGDRGHAASVLAEGLDAARAIGLVREQRRGERIYLELNAGTQQTA